MSEENNNNNYKAIQKIVELASQMGKDVTINVNEDGTYRAEIKNKDNTIQRDFDEQGEVPDDFDKMYQGYEKKGTEPTGNLKNEVPFTEEAFDAIESEEGPKGGKDLYPKTIEEVIISELLRDPESTFTYIPKKLESDLNKKLAENDDIWGSLVLEEQVSQLSPNTRDAAKEILHQLKEAMTPIDSFPRSVIDVIKPVDIGSYELIISLYNGLQMLAVKMMVYPQVNDSLFQTYKDRGYKGTKEEKAKEIVTDAVDLTKVATNVVFRLVAEEASTRLPEESESLYNVMSSSEFSTAIGENIYRVWAYIFKDNDIMIEGLDAAFQKGRDKAPYTDYSDIPSLRDQKEEESQPESQPEPQNLRELLDRADQEEQEAAKEFKTQEEIEDEEAAYSLGEQLQENAIVNDYKKGNGTSQIMDFYQISAGRLYAILDKHGIQRNTNRIAKKVAHVEEDGSRLSEMFDDYEEGKMTLKQIYDKYDIHKNGLFYLLDKYQVPRRHSRDSE